MKLGNSSRKRLAVIGGGMAGHKIAYLMQDTMNVTLIDPKTYVEVPMAVPRLLVEPDALPARIPYSEFLPNVTFIQGRAIGMTDESVDIKTDSGAIQTVEFDYAVIASGSRYADPLIKATATTEAERSAEISTAYELYHSARKIVIVGGGAVGVEIAAELCETFPQVKVVILNTREKLLEEAPSKFGAWAERFLEEHNVEVLLHDHVDSPPIGTQPTNGVVTTASGRSIETDAVIWATGIKIATEFVVQSWPNVAESDGRLKTDEFLRLVGHPTIFVVGDATNLPERRMAMIAMFHASALTKNLKALARAVDPTTVVLKPYKTHSPDTLLGRMMAVSLGRHRGLLSTPFGQFQAGFLTARIKSEDMLVGRIRKGVGLK